LTDVIECIDEDRQSADTEQDRGSREIAAAAAADEQTMPRSASERDVISQQTDHQPIRSKSARAADGKGNLVRVI